MLTDKAMEKRIQRELDLMEGNLFLDKEWDPEGQYAFYCVRHFIDPKEKPFNALAWRNDEGPLPLSMEIISVLRQNEGSLNEIFKKTLLENAVKAEQERQAILQHVEDLAEERQKRAKKLGSYGPGVPKDSNL